MLPVLLIVDDEKATRDALRLALEDDYEVFAVSNGKAARGILESEPVDILLTDLRLGGESGMDLIDFAQGLPKPPKCIMMTAYGSPDTAAEAKRHGAYYFVTKPLIESGELCYLSVCDFSIDIWKQLLYRKDKWMTLPMNAIIEHLSVNVL